MTLLSPRDTGTTDKTRSLISATGPDRRDRRRATGDTLVTLLQRRQFASLGTDERKTV